MCEVKGERGKFFATIFWFFGFDLKFHENIENIIVSLRTTLLDAVLFSCFYFLVFFCFFFSNCEFDS